MLRFVGADWPADEVASAFDVGAMLEPKAVDPSAVADRAAALATLEEEWEEERSARRGAAVLRELEARPPSLTPLSLARSYPLPLTRRPPPASKAATNVAWRHHQGAYDYASQQRAEGSWSRGTPLLRFSMRLEPDAPTSRTGHIVFDLYVQSGTTEDEYVRCTGGRAGVGPQPNWGFCVCAAALTRAHPPTHRLSSSLFVPHHRSRL